MRLQPGDRIEDSDGIRGTVIIFDSTGDCIVDDYPSTLPAEVNVLWDNGNESSTLVDYVRKLSLLELIAEAAAD